MRRSLICLLLGRRWDLLRNNTRIAHHRRRAVTMDALLYLPKVWQWGSSENKSTLRKKKKKRRWGFSSLAADKTYFGRILFPGVFSRGFDSSRSNEGLDGISILHYFACFSFWHDSKVFWKSGTYNLCWMQTFMLISLITWTTNGRPHIVERMLAKL